MHAEAEEKIHFELQDWVSWASKRMGANLRPEQIQMYVEEIGSWGLTQAELEALERLVRRTCDKWPGPATLRGMGTTIRFNKGETEPIFITRQDAQGRTWAKPTPMRRSTTPTEHDLAQWKHEAAPQEYARDAFRHEFFVKGLVPPEPKHDKPAPPHKDEPKPLTEVTPEEIYRIALGPKAAPAAKQYTDYDDSDEALRAAGISIPEAEDDW